MCRNIKLLSPDKQETIILRALMDSGATNSFIKLSYLPNNFRKLVENALLTGKSSETCVIIANICVKSATGLSNELCALV